MAAGTSVYGDWLTTVALLVLLFRLTHSPFGPALYMLARVAPRLVGPFPGGALADRFGPARIAAARKATSSRRRRPAATPSRIHVPRRPSASSTNLHRSLLNAD